MNKSQLIKLVAILLTGYLILAIPMSLANPISTVNSSNSSAIQLTDPTLISIPLNDGKAKLIHLPKIKLGSSAQRNLITKIKLQLRQPNQLALAGNEVPSKIDLGMENEPVLDQGRWGTCVTFAVTGAINAYLHLREDNRVSQLCNLQVGRSLEKSPQGDWNGSIGHIILEQISDHGFLPLSYQNKWGCGGLKAYPEKSSDNGFPMSIKRFEHASLPSRFAITDWSIILAIPDEFEPDPDTAAANKFLSDVKTALHHGKRVVFGSILDTNADPAKVGPGAVGHYLQHTGYDTWVLTPRILDHIAHAEGYYTGHEIIAIGYDDTACADYDEYPSADAPDQTPVHKKQCGLVKIRNSWGAAAGDDGDYYMSYAYFKALVIEAYGIGAHK